ncbi:MAG: PspC domain-containing protein [bacterium]
MAEEKKETKSKEPTPPKISGKKNHAHRRLYRSRTECMIGGVCGGVAEYFDIDPVMVRVLWAVSCLVQGIGAVLYILGWIIMPENPSQEKRVAKEKVDSKNTGMIWGVVLIVIGAFLLMGRFNGFYYLRHWHPFWIGSFRMGLFFPLLIIALGVFYVFKVLKKDQQPETTKNKASGGQKMDKKFTRSREEKMIGGVCGGIAKYFNVDPTIVRIAWALLTLVTEIFPGIIAYIVMLVIVPEESTVDSTPASPKTTAQKSKTKK